MRFLGKTADPRELQPFVFRKVARFLPKLQGLSKKGQGVKKISFLETTATSKETLKGHEER